MAASLYSEAGCTIPKRFVLYHKLSQTNAAKIDAKLTLATRKCKTEEAAIE